MAGLDLSEEMREYLWGRGAKDETLDLLGVKTWAPLAEPFPEWDNDTGEGLRGWLAVPVRSPLGDFLGVDFRCLKEKKVYKYTLPSQAWQANFLARPGYLEKIANGSDVWIVEGQFDFYPLEWGVPDSDVILATWRARVSRVQMNFLKRFCKGPVHMAYDNDEAGKLAMFGGTLENGVKHWGALTQFEKSGISARAVRYPYKDPGEVWDRLGAPGIQRYFSR